MYVCIDIDIYNTNISNIDSPSFSYRFFQRCRQSVKMELKNRFRATARNNNNNAY